VLIVAVFKKKLRLIEVARSRKNDKLSQAINQTMLTSTKQGSQVFPALPVY
jgi:hypothetical protein